jgi:ribosomal protein S18 acetylase RimI-like enzyme
MPELKIFEAKTGEDIESFRTLLKEYVDSLGIDLSFQNIQEEMANLPGCYARPEGCILMASYDGEIAGCVALRKLNNGICEGKRLYVKPQFRGLDIGKKLMEAIIEEVRKIGYMHIRGDTLPSMKTAQALYASLGFKEIEPYRYNPIEGAIFLELKLE